jgi:hypothetical protein
LTSSFAAAQPAPSNDRPLVFIYYREGVGRRSLAKLLTRNAARRITAGIAKLPEFLRKV